MSYQTLSFIAFLAVVLVLYYGPGRRHQSRVLLVANAAFYLISGVRALPFLLTTLLVTYFTAHDMGRVYRELDDALKHCEPSEKKTLRAAAKQKAKRSLIIGMVVGLGLLIVCKYALFIARNLNLLLGVLHVPQIPTFRMILPLGISFYTFMALGYLLSVYWRRYPAEEDFVTFAAFLTYFPHVAQGPIGRLDAFRAQIKEPIAPTWKNLTFGAQLMLWGFFKKLVVANHLGVFVDAAFDSWRSVGGLWMLIAAAVYSIQIYADFSGCIDIVTGASEMLGIRLAKNFDHPYFSRSMGEFWRRWHMSLMEWFKDYVYFPVSTSDTVKRVRKSLKEKGRTRAAELFASCFPILMVWLCSGIWHGADWKFVLWGMFHAALLIGAQIFAPTFEKANNRLHIAPNATWWKAFQTARTFALCTVGRVFFRAETATAAWGILLRIFAHPSGASVPGIADMLPNIGIGAFGVVVLTVVDILQERMPLRETLAKKPTALRWALIYGLLLSVIILGYYGPGMQAAGFIYEQF